MCVRDGREGRKRVWVCEGRREGKREGEKEGRKELI